MFASIGPGHGRRMAAVASSCSLLLLVACGGGMGYGGSSMQGSAPPPAPTGASCTPTTCAPAMITVTDAKGDFLSYIVSLTSLELLTANGATVETIPATTKVDFAQLVDLSEVLGAGQVPAADYVGAKLTIDYTNAQITADDGAGNPVALTPVDASGNPITSPMTVTVQLDNAHHLKIIPGKIGRLALDFNLAVSNVVDLTADTVTVAPTLVASIAPADTKPVRVRGSLSGVSTAGDDFVVDVMPFHDEDENKSSGQVTVHVGATTTYQINGVAYLGDPGIAALAALAAGTKVAAFGSLQKADQSFAAATVLAGSSLESSGEDRISGTVIARNQTTLTLRDATWSGGDGDFEFERRDTMVTVGPSTIVTEEGRTGSFTVADISVGQSVEASGVSSQGADGTVALDASTGEVNLDVTRASGTVTQLTDGSLTLSLQSLGGLPAEVFDFSGTGSSVANDASASAYVVDTGTLTQSSVSLNSPTQVLGFVTGFGMAPPDFAAETIVTAPSMEAELRLRFGRQGSTAVFTGLSPASTSLVLDLASLGTGNSGGGDNSGGDGGDNGGDGSSAAGTTVHDQGGGGGGDQGGSGNGGDSNGGDDDGNGPFIEIGSQRIDVRQLTGLTIAPDTAQSDDVFTIGHASGMQDGTFGTFSDFVTQLATDLDGSTAVIAVTASGSFDAPTSTFTATHIVVLLTN